MKLEGVPEGYEVVRWGKPKRGEWFLYDEVEPQQAEFDFETDSVLIVRKIEPILDLSKVRLKKGWIAQDKDGQNYMYCEKPQLHESGWGPIYGISHLYVLHIPWREDVPWTERIMEIPE